MSTEVSFFFSFVSLGTFSHYQVLPIQSKKRNGPLPSPMPWLVSCPRYFGAQGPVVRVLSGSRALPWRVLPGFDGTPAVPQGMRVGWVLACSGP